jgi:hypothetical protein
MANWLSKFKIDPIKPFLESGNEAIIYFARRDLLEERLQSIDHILPEVQKILKKQQSDS